jgi:uncharacterized protein
MENAMDFRFDLTQAEKESLHELVRLSITQHFDPGISLPNAFSDNLEQPFGAFVTLKRHGQLRGCIGHVVGDRPLWETISHMSRAAAFNDPRFPPLTREELSEIEVEISILSPLTPCPPENVIPGRHGLLVRKGPYSGLLLPQVATEYGWDRETFLAQTCRKAGLPSQAWRERTTELYCFDAVVF